VSTPAVAAAEAGQPVRRRQAPLHQVLGDGVQVVEGALLARLTAALPPVEPVLAAAAELAVHDGARRRRRPG
jgi:hypothetical protein